MCKKVQRPLVDSCVPPPSALTLRQGLNGNPYTMVSSKVTPRNVVVALQSLSHVRLFLTPWTAARQASLSFTIFQSLLKLMSMELVLRSKHLVLCCPSNVEDTNRLPRASNIPIWSRSVVPDSLRPMDCSTPGSPVHHHLPELAQTHVHWVSDAIQPTHPLSSPCLPTFSLSQHQGLFLH